MNAITHGKSDEINLSLKQLGDLVMQWKESSALKASRATLLCFSRLPMMSPHMTRLYGVPVLIDDSLALFEMVPIHNQSI